MPCISLRVNKEMRILFLLPYHKNNFATGVGKRAASLSRCLSLAGVDVEILTPATIFKENADVQKFQLNNVFRHVLITQYVFLLYALLTRRYDVIVSEHPFPVLIRSKHTKLMYVVHDAKFLQEEFSRKFRTLRKLQVWLSGHLSDAVVTVSNTQNQILRQFFGSRVRIITSYNGLSDEYFEDYQVKSMEYDLIYIANFAKHKDHVTLLKSLSDENWRICFVGSDFGALESIKKEQAKLPNITIDYISNVSERGLIDCILKSKCAIFPTLYEGFCMPLVEASALNRKIIARKLDIFLELGAFLDVTFFNFAEKSLTHSYIDSIAIPSNNVATFSWTNIAKRLMKVI